jgi:hypothetical protein
MIPNPSCPQLPVRYRVLLVCLAAILTPAVGRGDNGGWQQISQLLFNDASQHFRTKLRTEPTANHQLGLAAALLNSQPRTEGNVNEARRILSKIAAESAGSEEAILAEYLLARILQLHQSPPDPRAAAQAYQNLHRAHPGHPLAEQAAVKYAMLELYELAPDAELPVRFGQMEDLGATLRTPAAIRDFQYLLANARTDTQVETRKITANLLAADAQGFSRPATQANVWMRIAQFAHADGNSDVATRYAEKFIERFKRDDRRYTLMKQLESWTQSPE